MTNDTSNFHSEPEIQLVSSSHSVQYVRDQNLLETPNAPNLRLKHWKRTNWLNSAYG